MTRFYNTGTVATVQGNAVVTGTLTGWQTSLVVGGVLMIAGMCYPIASIDSDTQLTLTKPFPDASLTNVVYDIDKSSAALLMLTNNAQKVADLLDDLRDEQLHSSNQDNPHGVTKAQVGLGNVENKTGAEMPVSTAQQAALDGLQSSLETSFQNDLSGKQDALNFTPVSVIQDVGLIAFFAAPSAPNRWLKCNGAAISRTTYSDLFAVIGTAYGTGDGSTTFNLPDLRGEFIRGFDDGRGVDSGRTLGSAQSGEIQSHQHTIHGPAGHTHGTQFGNGTVPATFTYLPASVNLPTAYNDIWYAGGTGGSETRPQNIALLACIRY